MSNISLSSFDIHYFDELSKRDIFINKIHPLIKLIVTLSYCLVVISFNKYDVTGLIPMSIYPIIILAFTDISFVKIYKKIIFILPIIIGVGIFNPILDNEIKINVIGMAVNIGWFSFVTLILKGILTVFASFLLIGTTSIEGICYSLRILKVPTIFVNQILLTYRYIFVLIQEAANIYNAYKLRAPKQKGINYKYWGPLLGQLLIRSYDRASLIYESMVLRGFSGEFKFECNSKVKISYILYAVVWISIFILIRFINIPIVITGLLK